MKNIVRSFFLFIFVLTIQVQPTAAQTGSSKSYKNAVVVTADERASQVGRNILQQGGNAVDATVAVQFALAVTLPRAGNIGGGGFMMLHMQDGTNRALDFREKAPLKASENMYLRNGKYVPKLSRQGVLAVGVPGVVDGMVKALERYGRLPLETVMQPAIKLAREGYKLSWSQANDLNNSADAFKRYQGSQRYFLKSDGNRWQEGDLFIQKDLAQTLNRIANRGRDGFYSGRTADLIVGEMQKHGGLISYEDLEKYNSVWRDPITASYAGYSLNIMPPPSSGSIAIHQILDMLRPYDLKKLEFNSADYVHLVTETMRRAFADRAYFLGDPDFIDIPQKKLMSKNYNKKRMQNFQPTSATSSNEIGHGDIPSFKESTETTHFSIVDKNGNAVSVTTTLNGNYGSKVAVNGAGFFLNNEMDDFTAEPGEPNMFGLIQGKANAVKPEKRMLSSMSPTIVTKNGKVRMVLGAAGGPMIITATLHNFLNMAVFGMDPQQANSAPRFHHQWKPDKLFYEEFGISPDTRQKLQKMGHTITPTDGIGRAHTIFIDEDGRKFGSPDPRGDGTAEGY
ncbi:gamma-glutamyltranspeptidase / glutathione hydrolase [Fodinibius salinus]|uniref:Glutathione hydrolase proenzyme n=1 Tax=Fodinibius salinus TaxID=860790 RepID=A0A5D3YJR5_9BACT|nr:gamma-glutamyltransferase [Fodinibius salinus]TYP92686.1 gamma-glutamyltranspeptidase / glutathione hydrolase [Fodinibius salinus]